MTALSEAGRRLLAQYIEREASAALPQCRRLVDVRLGSGEIAKALVLRHGEGADKAAAERLGRQGFAIVQWAPSRLLVITAAGREALARVVPVTITPGE